MLIDFDSKATYLRVVSTFLASLARVRTKVVVVLLFPPCVQTILGKHRDRDMHYCRICLINPHM